MCCLTKRKSKCIGGMTLLLLHALAVNLSAAEAQKPEKSKLTSSTGVRLLKNKSFNDSKKARKEILELYRDLRPRDVLDGMDLIGLQDIGLL